ncbi:MAG TPA: malto-oligosyltrehalose trehalohydrolase [Planctomycetaceae bacterium]|nr:malto-oligosyltrehalose trehalohydrolase [Planctomycetaceae bacterium]
MKECRPARARRLPIGSELLEGAVDFRVWAPKRHKVTVVAPPQKGLEQGKELALDPEENGYFSGAIPGGDGMLYGIRLDHDDKLFPDPASRFQPRGPEWLSQVVDPSAFRWSDGSWKGVSAHGQVVYEMHVGTFTREGTWQAAARELPELAKIGITVLEVMPVADFVGEFGWGYDGVCLFAPTRLYGAPDDFRHFVDRAHAEGMGVILDVVYNHLGSVGNTLLEFSDDYKSRRYENEWGDPLNFDAENAKPVRQLVVANIRYWIDEFHLDGLRFDAIQAIRDASPSHILAELTDAAREAAGNRTIYLVAENERQDVRAVRPSAEGGLGIDATWNDDFHHAAMVRMTGHNQAYYSDYEGAVEEFLAVFKSGFIYQGQLSLWQKKPRGSPTTGLDATAFLNFLQNHDQIANSGRGERIDRLTSPGKLRAMTALLLLAPQTPLIFQGQEFAASSPFLYFADMGDAHAGAVRGGRARFLSQFPSLATPEGMKLLRDPADRAAFECCKLDFAERRSHCQIYDLHIDLLRLRREDPVFHRQRADRLDGAALGPDCLVLRFFGDDRDDRLLLVNFGSDLRLAPVAQPLLAPPEGHLWGQLWSSESAAYGGCGTPPLDTDKGWRIPGEAAVVLKALAQKPGESRPHIEEQSP